MTSIETIEAASAQCSLVSEIACAAMPRECSAGVYIALLAFSNDRLANREWENAFVYPRRPSARRGRK
jgi:hypothetical protein